MIEAKLAFAYMKLIIPAEYAAELSQTPFGKSPKTLNAVDMAFTGFRKFIGTVIHFAMPVSQTGKAIIGTPAIRVNRGALFGNKAFNNRQKGIAAGIRNNFRIDIAAAMKNAEGNHFAACAAAALAPDATSAEIAFIKLDGTGKNSPANGIPANGFANLHEIAIDGDAAQTRQHRSAGGIKVQRKAFDKMAEFRLGNAGTISVFIMDWLHISKLLSFCEAGTKFLQ